jgi:hypothetical protein
MSNFNEAGSPIPSGIREDVTSVEIESDPEDMFFATVADIGYLEDAAET